MEKKQKSFELGTKKRKISLRGASSEPKNLIVDIPPIDLDNHQVSIPKSKMNKVKTKSIFPEPTTLEPTQRPPKKKLKKANIENGEIDEPIEKKKKKHSSDIIQAQKSNDATNIKKKKMHDLLADIQKKTKKENELITELHNLKAELGAVKPEDEEQSSEVKMKSFEKAPMAKPAYQVHDMGDKFPILNDKTLIERFLKVPLTNNQKGRIRQAIKLSLQGTTAKVFPDIINGKIQAILSSGTDLTDSDLRRVRILHNMLKTALTSPEQLVEDSNTLKPKKEKKKKKDDGDKKGSEQKKVKGPKRYVVFLGNLPLNITKEKIMEHFREFNEQIISIRIPKREAAKKSAIAYVELRNEPSYELALSKHHSMMGTKRIRVLYTTQQKGKVSKGEAKAKSAKMIALQKAGKLVGSVPANKKRSHRRAIMNKAKAKQTAAAAVDDK